MIPLGKQGEVFTPFQRYPAELMDVTLFLTKILSLPANIFELYTKREDVLANRMSAISSYQVFPIYDLSFVETLNPPFVCIFSYPTTLDDVALFVENYQYPVLHISTEPSASRILITDFTLNHLYDYVESVVKLLPNTPLSSILNRPKTWKVKATAEIKYRGHFVTGPNELCLLSIGYTLDGYTPLVRNPKQPPKSNEPYINAIVESADAIIRKRNGVTPHLPVATSLILATPSKVRELYRPKDSIRKLMKEQNPRLVNKAIRAVQRQQDFYLTADEDLFVDEDAQKVLGIVSQENLIFTCALSFFASNNFAPVLRLPPAVNNFHGELKHLAQCIDGGSPRKERNKSKLFGQIQSRLLQIIDKPYLERVRGQYQVKIIGDAPIEWLPVDDLPLILRADVSRIPATPGKMSFYHIIDSVQNIVTPEDLREILIIRSFKDDDPIREHLKNAIDFTFNSLDYGDLSKDKLLNLNINWVDVSSEEEFIEALNRFSGEVMIFDGHGVHREDDEYGTLLIGSQKINPARNKWLYKVRVPPIVLLSACETHPMDGNSASVANAFLLAGAKTVLSTLVPIESKMAAIFVARLLHRIKAIPLLLRGLGHNAIRWSNVVSGMQRRQYVSELLFLFAERYPDTISGKDIETIMLKIGFAIELGNYDWYEQMLEFLAEKLNLSLVEIQALIDEWGKMPECINYIQIGSPELIMIVDEEDDFIRSVIKSESVKVVNQVI